MEGRGGRGGGRRCVCVCVGGWGGGGAERLRGEMMKTIFAASYLMLTNKL